MSSGYGFLNNHILYQCEYSGTFKNIGGNIDNSDVSTGYGSINIPTDLQQNNLESLMKYNDRIDTYMNETLQNEYLISGIGLLNSHTILQSNESNEVNEVNMSVYSGDINGDYCYVNSYNGYIMRNNNCIDYTNKIDDFYQNIFKGKSCITGWCRY